MSFKVAFCEREVVTGLTGLSAEEKKLNIIFPVWLLFNGKI